MRPSAFTLQAHGVITMLGARTPIDDRAVDETMIWLGLHPDGARGAPTPLKDERGLVNTPQSGERLTPHRFVDPSFTARAAKGLGPAS